MLEIVEIVDTEHNIKMVKIGASHGMTTSRRRSQYPCMWELSDWCSANQCGKVVSIRRLAFKTDAEWLMFKLRWD